MVLYDFCPGERGHFVFPYCKLLLPFGAECLRVGSIGIGVRGIDDA